jgi:hypothetical protein
MVDFPIIFFMVAVFLSIKKASMIRTQSFMAILCNPSKKIEKKPSQTRRPLVFKIKR